MTTYTRKLMARQQNTDKRQILYITKSLSIRGKEATPSIRGACKELEK